MTGLARPAAGRGKTEDLFHLAIRTQEAASRMKKIDLFVYFVFTGLVGVCPTLHFVF